MIPRQWDIILDDEKYFSLTNPNVGCNRFYYSTDPNTALVNIKFKQKKKFEPKLMVWMAMSSKGVSDVFIHPSGQAVRQHVYLNKCIIQRLLPFVRKHYRNKDFIFWPDLASAHYAKIVQERLKQEQIPFVSAQDNPPNVPQARSIETVWALLAQKVYDNNWEAKNLDALARRIRKKVKELDPTTLQTMTEGTRTKLRRMWRNGLYSIC